MLVKIIKGTYGYRTNPDEVRVIRKDSRSPAFELNDKEAERIISLGVAKRCDSVTEPDHKEPSKLPSTESLKMTEEDIESMGFNDLRKAAKSYGLDTTGTKEDLILRLKECLFSANDEDKEPDDNEDDKSDDGGEVPPEFGAQDPVM